MRTHTKEAVVTVGGLVAFVGVIHGGLWFHLFGIPNVSVFGFPFQYFWFVAGGPVALLGCYLVYDRLATRLDRDRTELRRSHHDSSSTDSSER